MVEWIINNEWILGILSAVLSGVIIAIINDNRKLRKAKKVQDEQIEKAEDDLLLGVARIMLKDSIETALDRGYTTSSELDVVNELYKAYENKGGNGTVKHLYMRYDKLKVH